MAYNPGAFMNLPTRVRTPLMPNKTSVWFAVRRSVLKQRRLFTHLSGSPDCWVQIDASLRNLMLNWSLVSQCCKDGEGHLLPHIWSPLPKDRKCSGPLPTTHTLHSSGT